MSKSKTKLEKKSSWIVGTLAKTSQNIFAYSFISEHSKHFVYIQKKTFLSELGEGGVDPPRLNGRFRYKYCVSFHVLFK